ncbi:MAG: gamma-glutamylcyclotransferase family protein [Verrucomicrobiales bacterium]
MNIFAYGSLMIPDVWEAVTGETHRSSPGQIEGFIRRTVRGASYPGIIACEGGRASEAIDGAIYYDVDPDSLAALDSFESDFYTRVPVMAEDGSGSAVSCQVYLVPPENAHLLSGEVWDLERFRAEHLAAFLGRNFG